MKNIYILLSLQLLLFSGSALSQQVYIAEIKEEIDLGLAPFIERVIEEAAEENADLIIFEINTFGGRVDAATQIRDAILGSTVPTVAFINRRAISAGALISLACEYVIMPAGGTIGASTVVDQSGQKVSEKYQSYMRSEMRATAKARGKRTDVAEAMVDERVVIEGLVDSTQLVSLTTEEALRYGMADSSFASVDEILEAFGLSDAEIIRVESNWAEDFVRFLNNPIITSLLIMMGMVGLFTEVKTQGWGLPGTLGLAALALFFGSSFILNLASYLEILLFLGGVALLLVEVFVIPGFGIAGISGIIMMVASLFLALINIDVYVDFEIIQTAVIQLGVAIFGSAVLIYLLYKYLPNTRVFKTFVLADATTVKEGYFSNPDLHELVGSKGRTLTPLRPAGIVVIDNKRYDVVTQGSYIEKDKMVEVIDVVGVRIVVEERQE